MLCPGSGASLRGRAAMCQRRATRHRRAAERPQQWAKRAKDMKFDGPTGALAVPLIAGAILEAVLPLRTSNSP